MANQTLYKQVLLVTQNAYKPLILHQLTQLFYIYLARDNSLNFVYYFISKIKKRLSKNRQPYLKLYVSKYYSNSLNVFLIISNAS